MVSPLLAPSGPLRIVHSSIVPNGVKSCRTSSSVCCLLSIPTKSLRSSVKAKSTELMWRPRQRASVGIAREQERVVEKQQVLQTRTRRTYLPPPHRAAPFHPTRPPPLESSLSLWRSHTWTFTRSGIIEIS